jgi:hypothetical protein
MKIIISHLSSPRAMAKNTFLIRASVNAGNTGAAGQQTEIDLGSYTNLGSSKPEVLRIHRCHVAMTDSGGEVPTLAGDTATSAGWQLTTQTQGSLVLMTDDSFVVGGRGGFRNQDASTNPATTAFEELLLAQDYENGYVVAVPSLFLLGFAGSDFAEDVYFSIILECSTEAMSKSNAVSLAISQQ